jgi:hypothetical protein
MSVKTKKIAIILAEAKETVLFINHALHLSLTPCYLYNYTSLF